MMDTFPWSMLGGIVVALTISTVLLGLAAGIMAIANWIGGDHE